MRLCFVGVRLLASCSNVQTGGPGYPFLSGLSPLTCLAWVTLPAATLLSTSSQDDLTTRVPPLQQSRHIVRRRVREYSELIFVGPAADWHAENGKLAAPVAECVRI